MTTTMTDPSREIPILCRHLRDRAADLDSRGSPIAADLMRRAAADLDYMLSTFAAFAETVERIQRHAAAERDAEHRHGWNAALIAATDAAGDALSPDIRSRISNLRK